MSKTGAARPEDGWVTHSLVLRKILPGIFSAFKNFGGSIYSDDTLKILSLTIFARDIKNKIV
jgi:hypothetical protein